MTYECRYTRDDVVSVYKLFARTVKKEDIIGRHGWFFNEIPDDIGNALDGFDTGTLEEVKVEGERLFSNGKSRYAYFLPSVIQPAILLNPGDRVRILRDFPGKRGGISSNVGKEGVIIEKDAGGYKVRLEDGNYWWYEASSLDFVAASPGYAFTDVITSVDDVRLYGAIGKMAYFMRFLEESEIREINAGKHFPLRLTGIDRDSRRPFLCGSCSYPFIILRDQLRMGEAEYAPFDFSREEDRALLRGKWIRLKGYKGCQERIIGGFDDGHLILGGSDDLYSAQDLLDDWEFLDGSSCARLVRGKI